MAWTSAPTRARADVSSFQWIGTKIRPGTWAAVINQSISKFFLCTDGVGRE